MKKNKKHKISDQMYLFALRKALANMTDGEVSLIFTIVETEHAKRCKNCVEVSSNDK